MKIENICIKCMKEKTSCEGKCQYCGFDLTTCVIPAHHLRPFSILAGKYLVGKSIGEGGFGITYIGMDLNLEMRVAIKEYYPIGNAVRSISGKECLVQPQSEETRRAYEEGREKFINEAKILAKCVDFLEIVTVRDFFRENNTAYIVMEYIDGKNLRTYLNEKGGRISTEETINMMKPLICSLGKVHKLNLIHRDISPDNIMLCKDGIIKILDFGGAREFNIDSERSMSVLMKPGYTPEEQYRTKGEQGPWTDIYALCATMYRCITGQIPQASWNRIAKDELKPITEYAPDCPREIEYAIQKGMNIYKKDRWQSMEELYSGLYSKNDVKKEVKEVKRQKIQEGAEKEVKKEEKRRKVLEKKKKRVKFMIIIALCVALTGFSVTERMIYLKTRQAYDKLQAQNTDLKEDYEIISAKLEEKDTEITKIKRKVEELSGVGQNTEQIESTTQKRTALLTEETTSADIQSKVGQPLSTDEIANIDRYFTSSKIERGSKIFNRINGKSYRDNDDISLESLRYLTIPYYNFDKQVILGEMIVNVKIQNDIRNIFGELFNSQYEIKSMRLIDDYWQEGFNAYIADNNSIEDNNTSCFCYRSVTGGENISNHGYGMAIDINPQQNPYVYNGENTHRNADQYMDRSCGDPHVIVASENDICYSTFTKYGFSWGGNWENPIDYQHFEKTAA